MRRDPRAFLWDVLDATTAINEFIARATFENCADTRLLRLALSGSWRLSAKR